jgi:D-hydroxyproline dehydrogenase subunit gamma
MKPRFVRLDETTRQPVRIRIDGVDCEALEGDTLSVAILSNAASLRTSDCGHEQRAGFCMMGACQDCWVWTTDGTRLRACSTTVSTGLDISTKQPEAQWANIG